MDPCICRPCVALCLSLHATEHLSARHLVGPRRSLGISLLDFRTVVADEKPLGKNPDLVAAAAYLLHSQGVPSGKQNDLKCSFCGRRHAEAISLVAGPKVYVCEGCVGVAAGALAAERR